MKILITGGHPAPALALIDELKKKRKSQNLFCWSKTSSYWRKNFIF